VHCSVHIHLSPNASPRLTLIFGSLLTFFSLADASRRTQIPPARCSNIHTYSKSAVPAGIMRKYRFHYRYRSKMERLQKSGLSTNSFSPTHTSRRHCLWFARYSNIPQYQRRHRTYCVMTGRKENKKETLHPGLPSDTSSTREKKNHCRCPRAEMASMRHHNWYV
jgi:hypothetical protein